MTAKQLSLVRDLRQFESSVCMEAAAEIERQALQIAALQKDKYERDEAVSALQATANRLLVESIKRERSA